MGASQAVRTRTPSEALEQSGERQDTGYCSQAAAKSRLALCTTYAGRIGKLSRYAWSPGGFLASSMPVLWLAHGLHTAYLSFESSAVLYYSPF